MVAFMQGDFLDHWESGRTVARQSSAKGITSCFRAEFERTDATSTYGLKSLYRPDVQDAAAWRGEFIPRDVLATSKALPAFTILWEEVSMISSCLTQGLLIAENAG